MISNRLFGGTEAPPRRPKPEGERGPPDFERQVQHWTRTLETFVVENPALSLGIAVAVGVCVGWLLKRR